MTRRDLLSSAFALQLPRSIRIGLIGVDGHVNLVTEVLPAMKEVQLAAYSSPAPSKARELRDVTHYTDARAMLDKEKLDVVAIATDDGARAAAVLECLDRKLPVFSEKPLAKRRPAYEKIKRQVVAGGLKLGMMLPLRYTPHFQAMRQIVTSGEIGEVAQIQAQKSYRAGLTTAWRNREESYSGTIPWVGIHAIDFMLFASGRRFVECAGFQTRIGFPEMGPRTNTAGVVYRMDNGGAAMLSMDYLRPESAPTHDDDRLRLAGTEGVAEYQRVTGVTLISKSGARKVENLPPAGMVFGDFLRSVFGGAKPTLSLDEIWGASEAAYAAREAAETGRVTRV
jgi:predicted dehydrogenase